MRYQKAILILNLFLSLFVFANEELTKEQNLVYYLKQNYLHGVLSYKDIEDFQKKIQIEILENPISEERTSVSIEAFIHYNKFNEIIEAYSETLDFSKLNELLLKLLSEIKEKEKQKEEAREETEDVTTLIARQIASGAAYTCVFDLKNKLRCWGRNSNGQLGYGDKEERSSPSDNFVLTDNAKIIQIAVEKNHTCVLFEQGKIKCWGVNNYGQLGYGDQQDRSRPPSEFVHTGQGKIIQLALGWHHTCVLFEQGKIKCWGNNINGQLGYGDYKKRSRPSDEFVQTGPEKIIQMALGASHTCVLFEQGKIKCWGGNINGRLGYGDIETRPSPSHEFVPTGPEKIIQIALAS
jgi:alpha-tubulin suppressor-like RCC1 family protein